MSKAERWTCKRRGCRRVALRYAGNEYGSALDEECSMEPNRTVEAPFLSMAQERRTQFLKGEES